MKSYASLKSKKTRGDVKVIRRGKTILLVDKKNPRYKAKQGSNKHAG